jgi:hypothetical protein
MINFAELKLKLTEFDDSASCEMHDIFEDTNSKSDIRRGQTFKHAQLVQFAQDAKIISQLLDVIENQDKHICILHNYIQHNEDNLVGDDLKGDGRFTERFKRHIKSTNYILSETESFLKKLIKGE